MESISQSTESPTPAHKPVMIVHGGAWDIPESLTDQTLSGVKKAVLAGYGKLCGGSSAADAVEHAVVQLEAAPCFDAGVGSCLTSDQTVEMDAAIMTDKPELGAVACLSDFAHPVSVARAVLGSDHCLLVGAGANQFATQSGFQPVESSTLISDAARREWSHFQQYGKVVEDLFNSGHDTVGAVALDMYGRIACATSTGGITFKRPGRVGDSPLVGAGLYCEKDVAGVSATGHGESIAKTVLCKHLVDMMTMCAFPVGKAAQHALQTMKERTNGGGGVVALAADGQWAAQCTTRRIAWACVDRHGVLRAAVDTDQQLNFGQANDVVAPTS